MGLAGLEPTMFLRTQRLQRCGFPILLQTRKCPIRLELMYGCFADNYLTTWLRTHKWKNFHRIEILCRLLF